MRRIGILGGTFNPIHLGHLVLAEESRQLLRLAKVIFVPASLPPHKTVKQLAPAQQRYRMVTLAVKSNPYFEVSDIEIKRGGVSYSVQTLRAFNSLFRHTNLYFIVGSDFLQEFSAWKDIDKINKVCKLVVAPRPGFPFKNPPLGRKGLLRMRVINIPALDISSTDIRKRIRKKRSIRYLTPEAVRKYILKKRLYH